jgi:hypothetical protein
MKKSHWITLIIVVVLIGIYFVARQKEPIQREQRFFKADSSALGKIEFISPQDTIIIVKKGKDWKLSYPLVWDVSESQLALFFKQVLPIESSSTPMSEDPGLQSMYKVDDKQAIQVKTFNKTGLLIDHVYIGNGTDTSFDYGRRQGDKKIYQFTNNITNYVRPDIFLWRSPNITNIKRANIARIDVAYTKGAYSLTMVGDSIRYTDKFTSFTISDYNRAQYKIINALENLMTYQFIDKGTDDFKQAFLTPDCKITVYLKDKSIKTFTLISKREEPVVRKPNEPVNTEVLMMIDNKPSPLYMMTGDFINRFTRASMHFRSEVD